MNQKTKTILTFVGGMLTGVVLTFVLLYALGTAARNNTGTGDKNIVLYERPQRVIAGSYFRIFQVLPNGCALAMTDGYGAVVFFMGDENSAYYDEQEIRVPRGKQAMQIGTYRYMNRDNMEKTVPVIDIYDEE